MYDTNQKRKWDNELVRESERFYAKQEGKKEEAVDIAGKMKNLGYPIKEISTLTGLSEEEIEKL